MDKTQMTKPYKTFLSKLEYTKIADDPEAVALEQRTGGVADKSSLHPRRLASKGKGKKVQKGKPIQIDHHL